MKLLITVAGIVFSLWAQASSTSPGPELAVYRNDLFSNDNRKVLETRDEKSWVRYDWSYQETVLDRDLPSAIGITARPERIDPLPATERHDVVFGNDSNQLDVSQTGAVKDARFAIVFIHGANGTKDLGASDVSFGANFNHAQSLAVRNGGVYLSPTVSFTAEGTLAVMNMIAMVRQSSPKIKIIVACGSAGAMTCWQLAESPMGGHLAGLILMSGSSFDENFADSPAARARVPVFFSHGTKDPLVPVAFAEHSYDVLHALGPNYPVRLELYEGGKHGTPFRLMDWKHVVEWML